MVEPQQERWIFRGRRVTGIGDLVTGQGDAGVRVVSQVFAWVTGRMACLSLSKDGIGRRWEFIWDTLTQRFSRDIQVEMEVRGRELPAWNCN